MAMVVFEQHAFEQTLLFVISLSVSGIYNIALDLQ